MPRSVIDDLERWKRRLKCGAPVGLLPFLLVVCLLSSLSSSHPWVAFVTYFAWFASVFGSLFTWCHSIKVAAALTAAPVAKASRNTRAETRRMRESSEPMDPQRWKSLVEQPVLHLECEVLPVLSEGWGPSMALVGAGLVLIALSLFAAPARGGAFNVPFIAALVIVVFGPMYWLPFALAMEPAAASSKCARLEDDINALCGRDSCYVPGMMFLKHIKALNKDQGLGFVVGGHVVTKRTLKLLATGMYSAIAVFGPTLLGEVGLAASCSGGAQHAACDFGWTFADDACFKLFGTSNGVQGEPLGWADAEEACQEMGSQTHLASVTSEEQQRAVAHLASDASSHDVWIGLNDFAEEGSFVWSDDEPLEYANWNANAKGRPRPDANGVSLSMAAQDTWFNNPETDLHPYICAKKATPVAASGGFMLGCVGGHWLMGTPYKQVGSLSYLPPTIVYGIYSAKIYDQITPTKITLNETVTTPAECAALVHRP